MFLRSWVVSAILLLPSLALAGSVPLGSIQVQVQDANGEGLPSAQIYLYKQDKLDSVVTTRSDGNVLVQLTPGSYRFYAAATHEISDTIDHYVTPNAEVELGSGEHIVVVLKMALIKNPLSTLTSSDLKAMGLDPQLAKALN